MKRFYAPYWMWEDVQNGMYHAIAPENEEKAIQQAVSVLSDVQLFHDTLIKVFKEWPIGVKCNLTNPSCNRQAWLGQAACCYLYKVPETMTRVAWGILTPEQRSQANQVAQKFINSFEQSYGREGQTVCI